MSIRKRPVLGLVAALAVTGVMLSTAAGATGQGHELRDAGSRISLIGTITVAKTASGRAAQTSPGLLGQASSKLEPVIIKYDLDPTASYMGGVPGLAATSPSVTHKTLRADRTAVTAYDRYAKRTIQTINARIASAVPSAKIGYSFVTVYGGVSALVPANSIATLLRTPGVAAVQKDTINHVLDDNTEFLGATAVWPSLGGSSSAGNNVVVGVIDTGIWPEHPMLDPTGIPAPAGGIKGCQFGNGSDADLGAAFSCNNKLIGAYAMTDTYMADGGAGADEFCDSGTSTCSPRDSEGHGTHTLTTAAGDCVASAMLYGVERGPVCGIAPGAHVEVFRVCLSQGCFSSDSVAAVQQAVTDGVNVINFSVSGGEDPYSDPVELAFLDATNAGVSVSAAAGNSGPGAGTAAHGGPWVTTVGASTGPRSFTSTLHLTADGGATLDVQGVTLTDGISSATPVVLAGSLPKAGGGLEDAGCQSDLAAGAATGKVVVCERGTNGRIDKGRRVLQGGAAGMILYNQDATVTDLESDNHYLPAIQTEYNANEIATFVAGHTNVKATWEQGTANPDKADVMASFSSRGPDGDWVKPDVTAPGVQVLAGTTPAADQTTADNGPAGNLYMAIAGTSMASPHSAGVSALVKAAHPTWTPEEIKSALMTSSLQNVVKESGTTPADPFDMGAGRIDASRAVAPTLVFNETYANFVAAGTDHVHRVDLNIPSIDATTFGGELTTHRTAINVSGAKQTLKVHITEPKGVKITVGSANKPLTFAQDATMSFPITISAPDIKKGQYFARIDLVPQSGANAVTIPIAFVKQQGAVTLTNTCKGLKFAKKTGHSHCTVTARNLGTGAAKTSITIANRSGKHVFHYEHAASPGKVFGSGAGVRWGGHLGPALAPPVTAINDVTGEGPNGGYLSLADFNSSVVNAGDESITDYTVPKFYYGGEPYTELGIGSDGYVVIGGGTDVDVTPKPQTFPDPARPNNVIAPFWTDLNPSAGGTIRIDALTNGTYAWLVVDYEAVPNFSDSTTHTGEIWLRLAQKSAGTGPSSEQVTVSYGAANAALGDPGSTINWGAENRDGSSGKNIASAPADDSEYRPVLGKAQTGGSVTLRFDLWGPTVGTWFSDARLTSNQTVGMTIVPRKITVKR
jgi:subtilisin family serine protease